MIFAPSNDKVAALREAESRTLDAIKPGRATTHLVITRTHREHYVGFLDVLVQVTIIVCAPGVDASYAMDAVNEATSILANILVNDDLTSHIVFTHAHNVSGRSEPVQVTIVVTVQ